jgi:hypothetical protein
MGDDFLTNGQAQTGSPGFVGQGVANLLEFFKHQGLIFGFDTATGVGDTHNQFSLTRNYPANDTTLIGKFDGIGNQVDDDLNQPVTITRDTRQIVG